MRPKSQTFDDIEKKVYQKSSSYAFLVQYDKEQPEKPSKLIGAYEGSSRAKNKYVPFSSFQEFIKWWANEKLSKSELEHLVEVKGYSHKSIFKCFFHDNPNVEFIDYDKQQQAKAEKEETKEFKDSLSEDTLKTILEMLKAKSYLYLHHVNEVKTIFEILLLRDAKTKTYHSLGQSTDKELTSMVVSAICASEDQGLKDWFTSLSYAAFGKFKNKRQLIQTIIDLLMSMPEYFISEVEPVSNTGDHPNYNFLDLNLYIEQPPKEIPAWDSFLELFNDTDKAELFMAWVWSVFDETNMGRQWMWVQGPGSDGKSSVIKTILHFMDQKFGEGAMYYSAHADSHKNTFFYGNVHGKRLIVFGDNKDTLLFKNECYQRISGGDHAPNEAKYARAYSAKYYSRILVASNYHPSINFWQDSEVTRAIVLSLDPNACEHSKKTRRGEATFEARLREEFEDFLARCHGAYEKFKKPGSHDFIVPEEIFNSMKATCASEETNILQYFMHTCLEFGTQYRVRAATLYEKFEIFVDDKLHGGQLPMFRKILQTALSKSKGCQLKMLKSPSGVLAQYMIGCKLKLNLPKNYAAVLREEDVLDMMDIGEDMEDSDALFD